MTFDGPSGLIPDTLRGRDAMCTTSIFAARVLRVRRTLYNRSMSLRATRGAIIALLLAGCASQSPVKSVDRMDERTAVTMGVLQEPLLFIESELYDILDTTPNQPTMIYLGPVEWDRSGEYTYGLWVEIAPGVGGHRLNDLSVPGAVTLELDDGPVTLSSMDLPKNTTSPYSPVVPEGQTVYFAIDVLTLRRMAACQKILLDVQAADLKRVKFVPAQKTHAELSKYVQDRGIATAGASVFK